MKKITEYLQNLFYSSKVQLLSAILIVVAIAIGAYLIKNPQIFKGRASEQGPWNFITRQGNILYDGAVPFRFSGANMHWLGLVDAGRYPSHFNIENGFETAQEMGANVVRSHTLGISVGGINSVEPSLNQFNDRAFEPIDYAIKTARDYNIRLIIPLTDNWKYYHGGKSTFTGWRGLTNEDEFYTNSQVIQDFKTYISYILNHVNQYTGTALKDDPTILAWETGNELLTSTAVWNDNWTEDVAFYIKSIDKNHLVADGHYASSSQNRHLTANQLQLPSVDLYTGHFYPMNFAFAKQDADLTASNNKVYFVGEFDSTNQDSIGGEGTLNKDLNVKIDGLASARVNITQANPSVNWYVQLTQNGITFETGKTYTISFWAKSDVSRKINVMLQKSTIFFTQDVDTTTSWKQYSFSYTPTVNLTDIRLRFNLAQATGNVWIDKVYFGTSGNILQNSSFETSGSTTPFEGWYLTTKSNFEFLDQFLPAIKGIANVWGSLFWELWPHSDIHGYSGTGKYDQHYPGDDAAMTERMKLMRTHAYNMRSLPVPLSKITNPPLLHPIISVTNGKQVDWRGVAAANTYNIERSQDGVNWQVIKTGLTAYQAPFTDATVSSTSTYYYRVQGVNLDGVAGAFSNIEPPINVSPTPTPANTTNITLNPIADTYVDSAYPTTSYGTSASLGVDNDPVKISYLKFDLSSLLGKTVTQAKLRVYITNPSYDNQSVRSVDNTSWTETGVTYNTKPALGLNIGTFASNNTSSTWTEADVTSFIKTKLGSVISIGVEQGGADGLAYNSKEAAGNKPQLVVVISDSATPTPTPTSALPTSTPTPTPTPPPAVLGTMTVASINMRYTTSGSNKTIYETTKVINTSNNQLFSGATVNMTLKTPSGASSNKQVITNSLGEASYTWKYKEKGLYLLTINNITKSGYIYVPSIVNQTLNVN